MDNKRLLSFLKSAELGSITAAAEELGYSTSAVSQLIASLEKEFEIKLLVRTTRGVYPTEDGKGLLPIIRDYLDKERLIFDYISDIKEVTDRSLTITAYPSIATSWLPEIIRDFGENYPGIRIVIMECVRTDIYRHLNEGEAELGFLSYAEPMPYEWIPLADVNLIAVLPEDHPLAGSSSYPIPQAEKDDFILSSYGHEADVLDMLKKYNISPKIKYSTYDTPVNLAMVQRGLGVSIANQLSARQWNDHIVKLPLDPPEKVVFGVAFNSYESLSTAARKFLDYSVTRLTQSEYSEQTSF